MKISEIVWKVISSWMQHRPTPELPRDRPDFGGLLCKRIYKVSFYLKSEAWRSALHAQGQENEDHPEGKLILQLSA